jgi:phosphoglycolate phosphatase
LLRFKNVLFDLDGTLTDPFEGIAASIQHAMKMMGAVPACVRVPEDALRSAIGPPLRKTFATLLATADSTRIEAALHHYRERYSTVGLFENRVYPDVPEMLAQLNALGGRLFVATSKPTIYAQRIIDRFDLAQYFIRVYGSELDGTRDNKTDLVRFILDAESISAVSAVMIGDRSQDVLGAKTNGMASVGAAWGYGSEPELRNAGADTILYRPRELLQFLIG